MKHVVWSGGIPLDLHTDPAALALCEKQIRQHAIYGLKHHARWLARFNKLIDEVHGKTGVLPIRGLVVPRLAGLEQGIIEILGQIVGIVDTKSGWFHPTDHLDNGEFDFRLVTPDPL